MIGVRYAIIGGTGFLGKKMVSVLRKEGDIVTPFSFNSENKIDIASLESVKTVLGKMDLDVIVNCAALTDVDKCEDDARNAENINSVGPQNLSLFSKNKNIWFVQISTDYVFDGIKGDYSETDFPNPINVYGRTKLGGEKNALSNNDKVLVLRISTPYGYNDNNDKITLTKKIIDNLTNGKPIELFMDQHVSPTLIDDAVYAMKKLINKDKVGIYHAAGMDRIDRYSYGIEVARVFELDDTLIKPVSINEIKFKAKRPKDSSLSIMKLVREGIEMSNVYDGLKKVKDTIESQK
ncbi:MAG: SDR family oxidoreductase [Candidatus Thermoplasmatota archaeon]|nr:SDR family oxidoreductase [Candidatus Thermoplasmatota archaeon]MCL5963974.1 SDR family oxidoreductase [Candidatus Thermoplasmatota archaeon]